MNYRHHFHAGNFADVLKHALLARLVRALQKKDKGCLLLDTHAGRGAYDLAAAATGDSLARRPEWPEGIGRIFARADAPALLNDYLSAVRAWNVERGAAAGAVRFYPGSPVLLARLARPQDRIVACERQPAECAALREELQFTAGVTVREMDGYEAVRAWLPPPERRALVLIDPPFEGEREFADIARALSAGLRRLAGGVFAVWYPLTERARVEEFFAEVRPLRPPPTLGVDLMIAGPGAGMKMKGCGLLVVNPPWQFEREAAEVAAFLGGALAQAPGGGGRVEWVVREG
ncbi:MAG: hypothetical protein RLZZ15_1969 [Verrucomicrobiota bacterium]